MMLFLAMFVAGMAVYLPAVRQAREEAEGILDHLRLNDSHPSVVLSADGKVLYSITTERRKIIDVKTLPAYVRYAIVAAEDRRFYEHTGVDQSGLARAAYNLLRAGHVSGGGSTITMQLAKQMVNGDARSFGRKLRDIAVAQEIERIKTKDEILDLYMNDVYFGEGAFGIQTAAEVYFGKEAQDLTVSEAAMLARCVRTPSRQNPLREMRQTKDIRKSLALRDYVLGVMHEETWITEEQYQHALEDVPKLNPHPPRDQAQYFGARYFVNHVLNQLKTDMPSLDLGAGGYRIETTLDYSLEQVAERALLNTIREHRSDRVSDGAIVVADKDGRILVEVGGPDFKKSQYNFITQGHRQPGSSFKPIVYATALNEKVIHVGDMINNRPIVTVDPITGKRWAPKNGSHEPTGGVISLNSAMAYSINLAAIHTCMDVGASKVVNYAHDVFGIRSELHAVPSLGLGTSDVNPLEMVEAYSVFMLHGDRVRPYPIVRVVGPDGQVVRQYQPQVFPGVLDRSVCLGIEDLLRLVVTLPRATGTKAAVVPNAHGKTGTTQEAKDAWFDGYADGLIGIAWVGNNDHHGHYKAMREGVYGGTVTVELWRDVMLAAHQKYGKPIDFSRRPQALAPTTKPAAADQPDEADVPALNNADPDATAAPNGNAPAGTDPAGAPAAPADGPKTSDPAAPPEKIPGPTKPGKTGPKSDETEYVEVEVCADTGLRATPYCPETVTRRYRKGSEPRSSCKLHAQPH